MRSVVLCLFAAVLIVPALADEKADSGNTGAEVKTEDIKLKDLVLKVPTTWKTVPSASSMRLATFETPTAKGDSEGGELTIFNFAGGGGDVASNLSRWIGQFEGEKRTSQVVKGKAGDSVYYLVDIAGSYKKSVGPPILQKTETKEGYRMLGVILVLEGKGVYYLKLAGPDATIKAAAADFRASFGGDAASEEAFEI